MGMNEREARESRIMFPSPMMGIVSNEEKIKRHSILGWFAGEKVCVYAMTPATEPIFWFCRPQEGRTVERAITLKHLILEFQQQDFACPLLTSGSHSAPITAFLRNSPELGKYAGQEVEIYAYLLGRPVFYIARLKESKEIIFAPSEYFTG